MPLEKDKNSIGIEIEVLEVDEIEATPLGESTTAAPIDENQHDDDIETEISEIVHHMEPQALSSVEVIDPILLKLDHGNKDTDDLEVSIPVEPISKIIALQQLEELDADKKRKVAEKKELLESAKVAQTSESVQNGSTSTCTASASDSSIYKEITDNSRLAPAEGSSQPKRILNKYAPVSMPTLKPKPKVEKIEEHDLIAILQGTDSSNKEEVLIEGEGQFEILHVDEVAVAEEESTENIKKAIKNSEASKVDARKIAVEQINELNKGKRNRRRKQDISTTLMTDLISSLANDWTDEEEKTDEDPISEPSKPPAAVAKVIAPIPTPPKKQPKPAAEEKKIKALPAKVAEELPTVVPFKRTRIIKRKIIWDPDAPETTFSYASLVKSSKKEPPAKKEPAKKEPPPPLAKKGRITPVPKKIEVEMPTAKVGAPSSTTSGTAATANKPVAFKMVSKMSVAPKPAVTAKPAVPKPNVAAPKRRAATPVNSAKKKKISEIDRLLGDEGAANMINSIEKQESTLRGKRESSVSPVEKSIPTKKDPPATKKRVPKSKPSSTWDYVYNEQHFDSMIIRRRSNSSYSSTTSPRRLSVDLPPTNKNKVQIKVSAGNLDAIEKKQASPTPPVTVVKGKQFVFAKPEAKNTKKATATKSDVFSSISVAADVKKGTAVNRKSNRTPTPTAEINSKSTVDAPDTTAAEVTVKKIGSVFQLLFDTSNAKIPNTFTLKLMNKIVQQLEVAKKDKDCKVVVFTSAGQNFCQGIDYSDLVNVTVEKRKGIAHDLAKGVRNFLTELASFPKPLIAGVAGNVSGLGVMILPLFDVAFGSDKNTYETPYVKMGQLPEGYCILNSTNTIRQSSKTKLLWLSEKITGNESIICGLITKLSLQSKVADDAVNCAKKIATFSSETYVAMKARNKNESAALFAALDEEQKIHAQNWSSNEFQEKLKQFISKESW